MVQLPVFKSCPFLSQSFREGFNKENIKSHGILPSSPKLSLDVSFIFLFKILLRSCFELKKCNDEVKQILGVNMFNKLGSI